MASTASNAGDAQLFSAFRRTVLWFELALTCKWRRVDVVHIQWLSHPREDYWLVRLLQLLGMPVVYTAHNVLPHESDPSVEDATFARIYGVVDRIVVHAERNRDEILERFDVKPEKIAVIPHGAYELFYREGVVTKEEARAGLGLPNDRKIILFFGAIRRYKGLEYLVDAFHKARRQMDGLLLLVVGKLQTPHAEDHAYYTHLLEEIASDGDMVYRGGYVPVEQVGRYFRATDIVALPYAKTYQSGILALAYAGGRPVIVSDTGGLAEVVEPGKSGFVVPPCDSDSLATAILDSFADPDMIDAMGCHAEELAGTRYSWNGIATRTLQLYRSATGSPSPAITQDTASVAGRPR
jgi:glycosyltransferase involved in cell wall biosynthesis